MVLSLKYQFTLFLICCLFCLSWAQIKNEFIKNTYVKIPTSILWLEQSQFMPRDKRHYCCFEKNDTLCFNIYDSALKQIVSADIKVNPLFYHKKNKSHQYAQSLQLKIDTSKTQFNNRIYISWADQKNGENNWDVFLVYSDDMGLHWTEPILITYRPNHKNQFTPKLFVNQKNGQVNLLYDDQQNYLDKSLCDVYFAQSNNGGLKFEYYKLNGLPIKVGSKLKIENELTLLKDVLIARWSNNFKRGYFEATISDSILNEMKHENSSNILEINNTVVFKDKINLTFNCLEDMEITFELSKPIEPRFKKKIIAKKQFKKGNNQLLIDMKDLKLIKSNYILTLYYKGVNKYIWITEE